MSAIPATASGDPAADGAAADGAAAAAAADRDAAAGRDTSARGAPGLCIVTLTARAGGGERRRGPWRPALRRRRARAGQGARTGDGLVAPPPPASPTTPRERPRAAIRRAGE